MYRYEGTPSPLTVGNLFCADEKYIPKWDTFFEKLSNMFNDQNTRHESVLVEIAKGLGQPTQLPVEYPEQVAQVNILLVPAGERKNITSVIIYLSYATLYLINNNNFS